MNTVHFRADRTIAKRRAREERVLHAASEIVANEGIEALSLHRLARELDYVPAALYRYFASKDALIAALQRRAIAALHADFRRAVATAEGSELEGGARALAPLIAAARFYLELPERAPEHFRLVSVLLADPRPLVGDEHAAETAPVLLAFLTDVAELLGNAAAAGALSDGDALDRTLVLWSSLQGVAQLGKLARFDDARFDVQRLGAHSVRALLVGWGAACAAIDQAMAGFPGARARSRRKRT